MTAIEYPGWNHKNLPNQSKYPLPLQKSSKHFIPAAPVVDEVGAAESWAAPEGTPARAAGHSCAQGWVWNETWGRF